MQNLTEKQAAVLGFIEKYQLEYGKSPTIKEIREHFGLNSDNSILKHLKALVDKGFLEKDDTPRGIKLLESVKNRLSAGAVRLPLLGYIPAGGPVTTEEYVQSWQTVSEDLVRNTKSAFLLSVTGESMIDAGIFEGDILVVDAQSTPKVHDIVVALVDNQNTVKRLMKSADGRMYLKAENPNYKDIYPDASLEIQGVVSSLIRQYR